MEQLGAPEKNGKDWKEQLAARFPDAPHIVSLEGSVFEKMLGAEWALKNPKLFLFVTAEDLEAIQAGGLDHERLRVSIVRVLSHPSSLEACPPEEAALRAAYRDIHLHGEPDFWRKLEGWVDAAISEPGKLADLCVLALSLWPGDPKTDAGAWKLWFLAGYAFVQLGDAKTASGFLEQSIALKADALAPLNELAALRLQEGRREEGSALLERVFQLEPENLNALCNAAGLRLELRKFDEARAFIERARAVEPEDEQVQQLSAMLARMSGPPWIRVISTPSSA